MSKKSNRRRKQATRRARDGKTRHSALDHGNARAATASEQPERHDIPEKAPGDMFSLWVTPPASGGPQRRIDSGPAPEMLTLGNIGKPRERPANVQVALGSAPPETPNGRPPFDPKEVLRRYVAGDHAGAVDACRQALEAFGKESIDIPTPEFRRDVNTFVETLLFLLSRPDLVLTRSQTGQLMAGHHILANLTAISVFKSTDAHLAVIGDQSRNFGKTLLLHSVRNRQHIDPKQFFDADPQLASMWYATYGIGSVAPIAEHVWNNLKRHLAYVDDRLQVPDHRINGLLFQATYVDDDCARAIKTRFNADIQRQIGSAGPKLVPVRDRIAIVSGKWRHGTAVYRSMSPLVETLRAKYRLTLVCLGETDSSVVTDGFDEVRNVLQTGRTIDCTSLNETDFQLAFFPDVGMTSESIWLSNMRLAPIQAVGYGHPTTTAGSRVDYFIGGAEVEVPSKAQEFYSERLVLIPGLAAVPVYPTYSPQFPKLQNDRIVINLPWGVAKVNYPMVRRLKAIRERLNRPVAFQFLPGSGLDRYNAVSVALDDLGAILGKDAKVYSNRAYTEYMETQEQAHFSLDSYPFGGYNTIVDSLHLGKPIVAQEGDRFYNRASSALLRRLGLDELIAHSEEEYIDKAVRLATDDVYRTDLSNHLRSTNLKARIFDDDSAQYFRKAIDYLIENHGRLQAESSHEPVFIR